MTIHPSLGLRLFSRGNGEAYLRILRVPKIPSVMHSISSRGTVSRLPFRQSVQSSAKFSTCPIASSRFNFKENNPGWNVIVGIEVHAQIKSRSKLFSSGSTFLTILWLVLQFSQHVRRVFLDSLNHDSLSTPVNRHVSLFDAAFPGTLPVGLLVST